MRRRSPAAAAALASTLLLAAPAFARAPRTINVPVGEYPADVTPGELVTAVARYLAHRRAAHAADRAPSQAEFYSAEIARKWDGVRRCC